MAPRNRYLTTEINMTRKKGIFELDRDGGKEKVMRATYSPQQYRKENAKSARRGGWSVIAAVVIGSVLGFALYLAS